MANINQPILNADENNVQLVTEGTLNTNQDLLHLTNDNRYDHIKDPHVKMLMTLNLESSAKEDIVNLLLQSNVLSDKKSSPKKRITTAKNTKYNNVVSQYNKENLNSDPNYKSINFHIQASKDNPEFTNDFWNSSEKIIIKNDKRF